MGPGKDTHGTRGPVRGKVVGGPTTSHDTRRPDNDKPQDKRAKQQPGADRHLESYMAAEQRDDRMADESNTSSTRSKRSPGSSRRSRRETKPTTPKKINQETDHTKQNETKHIKIPQNQCTDKIVDVSSAEQRKVSQIRTTHRKSRTRRPDKWI